jgi:hypothetical protein
MYTGDDQNLTLGSLPLWLNDNELLYTYDNKIWIWDLQSMESIDTGISGIAMDVLRVTNSAPIADAGPDQNISVGVDCMASVTLDGTGSNDPDGNSLSYFWTWADGSTSGEQPIIKLPLGEHTITLVVSDGIADSEQDTVVVTVQDTTLPDISLTVSPEVLWPPNHKMVPIEVTITANDNCDDDPTIALESIAMNEGDENDIHVDVDSNIFLRAERYGTGDGRIYDITYEATDDAGNINSASATVTVPHDKGKKNNL